MNSKEIGNLTEDFVTQYLTNNGYIVLKRNFHCPYGEIDIIAQKENCICVVEVKRIPANWDILDIKYKISYKKINNIKKTFSLYLAQSKLNKYNNIRFDIAVVTNGTVYYFEGAF